MAFKSCLYRQRIYYYYKKYTQVYVKNKLVQKKRPYVANEIVWIGTFHHFEELSWVSWHLNVGISFTTFCVCEKQTLLTNEVIGFSDLGYVLKEEPIGWLVYK